MTPFLETPEFLAVGHVTHDLLEGGYVQPGGAALYASLTAFRMGKKTAVLTSCGEDFVARNEIEGIDTKIVRASQTSRFRNAYGASGRVQYVYEKAASLESGHLPSKWSSARIAYLCPVLHEVPMNMAEAFKGSLIGVAPQGWMRSWDAEGRIQGRTWEGFEGLLERSKMVIVSEEDVVGQEGIVDALRRHASIVIVTRAARGAVVFVGRRTLSLGVHAAQEKDPTGAGDCFGAAFLVRYAETGSIEEAGRFASCVGACVIEKAGIAGIPTREAVDSRMREEVVPMRWDES